LSPQKKGCVYSNIFLSSVYSNFETVKLLQGW